MAKLLSAREKYLFGLTGSAATTPAAQRAAIAREGLTEKTNGEILRERREAFAQFRERKENQDLKGMPAWLAAARFESSGDDWRHVPPIPAGKPANVSSLAAIAHEAVNWGRLRKHQRGSGESFAPRVTEEDNGETGWNRVVRRYACYLCVLSPDRKTVAVQTRIGEKITLHKIRNGQFIHAGRRHFLKLHDDDRQRNNFRADDPREAVAYARAVRRYLPRGYDCLADERGVWVSEKTTGELYHFGCKSRHPFATAVAAFRKRAQEKRLAERDQQLTDFLRDNAARVWVSYGDSIAAGNCEAHSKLFRDELCQKIGASGEVGAVRADVLLAVRDDNYSRRACRVAALRTLRG